VRLSTVKKAIIKIFSDRNVQLTITLFGIGFLLALMANYPTLEERIEKDTLVPEDGVKRIEARLSRPYDEAHDQSGLDGIQAPLERPSLKSATLELHSETDNTNASIILEQYELPIKSWEIEDGEDKTINMTEYHEAEYIEFKITDGELSYTYTVNHYIQPYSFLSIPGFILMSLSLIFLIKSIASLGPIRVNKEEKNKKRKNQKVIGEILKERTEEVNSRSKEEE